MASPFFVFVEEVFLSGHIGLRLCVLLQSSPCNSFARRRRTSMSLKITNSDVDGVSVLELDGRIVLGEESNSLRVKLKSLVAAGKDKIVLNVANIKYIDSTGLGTLVAAHLSAKTQGASVRLCQLGK